MTKGQSSEKNVEKVRDFAVVSEDGSLFRIKFALTVIQKEQKS